MNRPDSLYMHDDKDYNGYPIISYFPYDDDDSAIRYIRADIVAEREKKLIYGAYDAIQRMDFCNVNRDNVSDAEFVSLAYSEADLEKLK